MQGSAGNPHRRLPPAFASVPRAGAAMTTIGVESGTAGGGALLRVDKVTLQYKTAQHLVTATWRVGFEVYEADRFVLLGPSGCGKSTVLKAIGGFIAPAEGSIRL